MQCSSTLHTGYLCQPLPTKSRTTTGKQEALRAKGWRGLLGNCFLGVKDCDTLRTLEWQLPEQEITNQLPTWMKRGFYSPTPRGGVTASCWLVGCRVRDNKFSLGRLPILQFTALHHMHQLDSVD